MNKVHFNINECTILQVGHKSGNVSVTIPFSLNLIENSTPWHIQFPTKIMEFILEKKLKTIFPFLHSNLYDIIFFSFPVFDCRVWVEKNYWWVNVIFIFPVFWKWNFQVEYYALRAGFLFPVSKQYWANISCIVYIFANIVYIANIGQSWRWLNEILLRHWAEYILIILKKYFATSPFFNKYAIFVHCKYSQCKTNIYGIAAIFPIAVKIFSIWSQHLNIIGSSLEVFPKNSILDRNKTNASNFYLLLGNICGGPD